jgi:anaerobic ribonucleoside-triphosphate reductase activating protein
VTQILQVSSVLHRTIAEGPGERTAIWVQGCSIRCNGCINPHLFATSGGTLMSVSDLAAEILDSGVEGITLLGGEPFDQPEACAKLAGLVRQQGLGVITFTGYLQEDLRHRSAAHRALIAETDLLVDGPYRQDEVENERALVGSNNQRFLHLTNRYIDYDPANTPNRLHARLSPEGSIELAGFLDRDQLSDLTQDVFIRRLAGMGETG